MAEPMGSAAQCRSASQCCKQAGVFAGLAPGPMLLRVRPLNDCILGCDLRGCAGVHKSLACALLVRKLGAELRAGLCCV